jgi:hypothetical protein
MFTPGQAMAATSASKGGGGGPFTRRMMTLPRGRGDVSCGNA